MTILIYLKPNSRKEETYTKEIKDIKINGKVVKWINYTETTASKHFCEVCFLDNKIYWIAQEKIKI